MTIKAMLDELGYAGFYHDEAIILALEELKLHRNLATRAYLRKYNKEDKLDTEEELDVGSCYSLTTLVKECMLKSGPDEADDWYLEFDSEPVLRNKEGLEHG